MTNRLFAGLLGALLLLPTAASAQEDWESFKPAPQEPGPQPETQKTPQPAPQPTPAAQPPSKPAPAPQPTPAAQPAPKPAPTAAAPSTQPAPSAAQPEGEATLVSTKESMEGEVVDHSPSTLHFSAGDPRNMRDAAGEGGAVGVLHVGSAHFGRGGLLHVTADGEYFRSSNFPVLGAQDTRSSGVFALGYNFTDWLQGYASYTVTANTNTRSAPHLIQDQGDASLGLAVGKDVAKGLSLGLDLRALLSPGTGNQDVSRSAFGFYPRGLATYDFHALSPTLPLRAHFNVGVLLDKTSKFASGHTLTAAEEFALAANGYNDLTLGAALEAPLPIATPFVEYNGYIPLGAKNLVAPDTTHVSVGASMQQALGLGLKITAIQDLTLNAAVDLGLARTVAYGIPATMPWNFIFGATYTVDPFGQTRTKIVDRTYERKTAAPALAAAPSTGRVQGVAIDASTGKPIPGVLVAIADRDLPPVATDASAGRFLSYDLPPGQVKLQAQHAGYVPAMADATVEAGKTSDVEVKLVPEAKPAETKRGSLTVKVLAKRKPIAGAKVTATPPGGAPVDVAANGAATKLPEGHYTLSASADGFEPASKEIDLAAAKPLAERFDLKPVAPAAGAEPVAPKKQLVVIVKNKVVIKQQVHFATNKAVILRDSFGLLDQVAQAIKDNNLKKVVVEGHTDNVGPKDANLKLSQDRANAVRAFLIKRGVSADVLEAKGYGDTKPIAPNMTAKGRELNRRVEFTIEEK